ncbi:putative transcription factor C2C2-GATA family [Medicago truncatula]|uniref:Putative transcription factor C2C2-GATA family n=1 Tax=Medicago truncatula TaxID=3880 RepID=A0A396K4B7_MEDTR|nr:putative transcription factor C2C2-GATA family [Medicago truncatula]
MQFIDSTGNDILSLEWLSDIVDDSRDENITMKKVEQHPSSSVNKEDFVLPKSNSSPTCEKTTVRRTRSKRPRLATFSSHHSTMQLISSTSSFVGENMQDSVISNKGASTEKFPDSQIAAKKQKLSSGESKKNKKTKAPLLAALDHNALGLVRQCTHCEATKTPQWRTGPEGPKTLCNACGVRYKSGRLCPEYRPAASSTFSPDLHSNSHKKILEMRVMRRKDNKNSGILALEYM